MVKSLSLLNRVTSRSVVGSFWDEIRDRARTERGDRPMLDHPWIRDYCEVISDNTRSAVYVQGCSQVGKSYFNFLNASYQASRGYRVLVILPTQEALFRNIRNQVEPITRSWGLVEPIGAQTWKARGNGAIVFGYASTSGSAPSKSRGGLANTGGSGSAVSCDILIVDELSQVPPDSLAPFERRLDAGCLPSRPIRYLGTAGAGGGIERFTRELDPTYPECRCPYCDRSFDLDPCQCLFNKVSGSGWIDDWNKDGDDRPCVQCPRCNEPLRDPLPFTRIKPRDRDVALHLTPLLRRGDPSGDLIRSMLSARRNGGGAQDWLQQALGVPSSLRGFMSLEPKHLEPIAISVVPNSHEGIFCGVDQGIGTHYGARISVYRDRNNNPVFQVLSVSRGDSTMLRELTRGMTSGLIDSMPDRTLAANLSDSFGLKLSRQKYNLGYLNTQGKVKIGDYEEDCIELPVTPHLTLMEAAIDKRLVFDCDLDSVARKHLCGPKFDRQNYKLIRPDDHDDDLYFALYFAVSAWLAENA